MSTVEAWTTVTLTAVTMASHPCRKKEIHIYICVCVCVHITQQVIYTLTLSYYPTWSPSEPGIFISLTRNSIFRSSQHLMPGSLFVLSLNWTCVDRQWFLDFTSSSSLYSGPVLKHAVAEAVVAETVVAVKAAVAWTKRTHEREREMEVRPSVQGTSCWITEASGVKYKWTRVGSVKLKWERYLLNLKDWKMIETPSPICTRHLASLNASHIMISSYHLIFYTEIFDLIFFCLLSCHFSCLLEYKHYTLYISYI